MTLNPNTLIVLSFLKVFYLILIYINKQGMHDWNVREKLKMYKFKKNSIRLTN